uniref:Uncharacterized protein n=1 Tax=Arundo donax TaxID=35708 RepID=A0A0A9AJH0_ARUDO
MSYLCLPAVSTLPFFPI